MWQAKHTHTQVGGLEQGMSYAVVVKALWNLHDAEIKLGLHRWVVWGTSVHMVDHTSAHGESQLFPPHALERTAVLAKQSCGSGRLV